MTRTDLEQKAREILTLAMNAGLPYSQAEDVRAKILSALVEAGEGALEKRAEQAERERDEARDLAAVRAEMVANSRKSVEDYRLLLDAAALVEKALKQQLSEAQAAVGVMVEACSGRAHPLWWDSACSRSAMNGRTPQANQADMIIANLPTLITADLKRREVLEEVALLASDYEVSDELTAALAKLKNGK